MMKCQHGSTGSYCPHCDGWPHDSPNNTLNRANNPATMAATAPLPDPLPERDALWCRALLSGVLNLDQVAAVLKRFNEIRPN